MRAVRRGGRGLAVLACGAGIVALGALPAAAAAGISVTRASDGATIGASQPVTSDDTLNIRAQIDPRTDTTDLVIVAPAGDSHTVAEASGTLSRGATMAFDLNTACLSYDPRRAPCSGRSPAPNGTWTAQLRGGASTATQFVLRIPPAAPTGVTAVADGKGAVISWQEGAEPDLRSYDVLDGSGRQLAGGLAAADVCGSDGACTTRLASVSSQTFMVRAHRATCPSCSDTVTSPPSAAATMSSPSTVTPVPSESGSPSSGGSGGQQGSTGGSTTGGTPSSSPGTAGGSSAQPSSGPSGSGGTTARPALRAAAGDSGRLLQALLPPPTAERPPSVPASIVAPLADGTYKPKLAYGEQTVGENVLVPDGSAPQLAGNDSGSVLGSLVDTDRIWQSVAEGVLLLVVCAHLMAWLARTRPE